MNLQDLIEKEKEWEKWTKDHWIQSFFIGLYHYVFFGIPNRIGDMLREVKYGFQRMFIGYDETASWGLDSYLTEIILPNLIYLRKHKHGVPILGKPSDKLTFKQQERMWNKIMDKVILAFQKLQDWDNFDSRLDIASLKKDQKIIDEGLALFAKHYRSFWD